MAAGADGARRLREVTELPGPRGWPLIGNLAQIRPERVHHDVEAWCRRYGPLIHFRMGRTPILVVADHDIVNAVLRDRPDTFRRIAVTAQVSEEMGGLPGLFLAEGRAWRDQRRMVMAAFAPHAVKAYFPALVNTALRLRLRWQAAADEGRAVALTDDLKRYSVDIVAGLAFGTDVNTIDGGEDGLQRHMDIILTAVSRRSISLFPYWRWFKLPVDRQLDRSVVALNGAVTGLIAAARGRLDAEPERRSRPSNLLEAMIVASDEGGSGVDDVAVAGNALNMLLAGEDTTANSLAWMLYLLKRKPAALRRARDEVLRVAPDVGDYSVEQMDGLAYLDACIQEAMRLKPVAPFIPLQALRETAVGDVRVPMDGMVWCVMRHDSVSERHFPDAQTFEPERWLQQGEGAPDKRVSLPFGAGARTCPGRYLALLEIKIAAAMLLAGFDIDSVDTPHGGEAQEVMGFLSRRP
jgi:cytochrome P450